jgi:hypothetical protein
VMLLPKTIRKGRASLYRFQSVAYTVGTFQIMETETPKIVLKYPPHTGCLAGGDHRSGHGEKQRGHHLLGPHFRIRADPGALQTRSDLCIPRMQLSGLVPNFQNRWNSGGNIYKSLTDTVHECRNWEIGRAISFLGIPICFEFSVQCL